MGHLDLQRCGLQEEARPRRTAELAHRDRNRDFRWRYYYLQQQRYLQIRRRGRKRQFISRRRQQQRHRVKFHRLRRRDHRRGRQRLDLPQWHFQRCYLQRYGGSRRRYQSGFDPGQRHRQHRLSDGQGGLDHRHRLPRRVHNRQHRKRLLSARGDAAGALARLEQLRRRRSLGQGAHPRVERRKFQYLRIFVRDLQPPDQLHHQHGRRILLPVPGERRGRLVAALLCRHGRPGSGRRRRIHR